MRERVRCEFALIRYVPDPVKGEFANIGVVLRAAGDRAATVRFTRDWSRVRCLDGDADTAMLESLEAEIGEQMTAGVSPAAAAERSLLETLQDSFSNSLQMTEMRGTLAESLPAEMEQLLRIYVEPMKQPRRPKKLSGRTEIAGQMRDAFTRAGVWGLLRKRVAASEYTRAGDSLKLDCGYRNGSVRMFPCGVAGTRCGDGKGSGVLAGGAAGGCGPG